MSGSSVTGARVTYLVIAFNHARFISQCLDSIFDQSEPVHTVVIDDASTDDTSAVIREYQARTGRTFTYLRYPVNLGLGPSLVEGLAMVDTEFFGYIAADDWMEPDRTRIQVAAIEQAGPTCAFSYSDVFRADESGHRIEPPLSVGMGADWQPDHPDPYAALLRANWIPAPSILIRTASLREVGGYDPEIFYEDLDVVLRLTRQFTAAYVDVPVATHRELSTSLGHRMFFYEENRSEWLRARVLILRKHLSGPGCTEGVYVAGKLRDNLAALYLRGGSASWLLPHLRDLRSQAPDDPIVRRYHRLASLRVPGRLVAKVLGGIARLDQARRIRNAGTTA